MRRRFCDNDKLYTYLIYSDFEGGGVTDSSGKTLGYIENGRLEFKDKRSEITVSILGTLPQDSVTNESQGEVKRLVVEQQEPFYAKSDRPSFTNYVNPAFSAYVHVVLSNTRNRRIFEKYKVTTKHFSLPEAMEVAGGIPVTMNLKSTSKSTIEYVYRDYEIADCSSFLSDVKIKVSLVSPSGSVISSYFNFSPKCISASERVEIGYDGTLSNGFLFVIYTYLFDSDRNCYVWYEIGRSTGSSL